MTLSAWILCVSSSFPRRSEAKLAKLSTLVLVCWLKICFAKQTSSVDGDKVAFLLRKLFIRCGAVAELRVEGAGSSLDPSVASARLGSSPSMSSLVAALKYVSITMIKMYLE
ncbi:unnamed protein product [Ranitomeya imitator]|uniref:Secreted protein n=1 Tax=Ranitomeya imitator TaxID=111125 RepID=A0ABN9KT54_9NEOB|nr:unnamed protein product [Ranitomeya imitator]